MKKSQFTVYGQQEIEKVFRMEDESWNQSRHWWEPAEKTGPAVEDMRRFHAAYLDFKRKIEADEEIEPALKTWAAEHRGVAESELPELHTGSNFISVPEFRFLEAIRLATRELELSRKADLSETSERLMEEFGETYKKL